MKVGTSHGTYTVQSGATSAPKKSKGPNAEPSSPYDSNLSLYTVPPTGNVTPDEFELLAQDRLICTSIKLRVFKNELFGVVDVDSG